MSAASQPQGQSWVWPPASSTATINNLVTGFVFNITMTSYSQCSIIDYTKPGQTCEDDPSIWARIPRSIFMGIDTVYMDNPAEYKQIWKPMGANSTTSPAAWSTSNSPLLAPNSTIEIKFDPGYYLVQYVSYKDAAGAVVGMQLVATTIDNQSQKVYIVGEAFIFNTDPNADPSQNMNQRVPLTPTTSSCNGYVVGFAGNVSNRVRDDSSGGYFNMDTCTDTVWTPAITLDYNNSANYQCCFKTDTSKCSNYISQYSLCGTAVDTYCSPSTASETVAATTSTGNTGDYMCKRYLAAKTADEADGGKTAFAMLYGYDSSGNPTGAGTGFQVVTNVVGGITDDTSVTLSRFTDRTISDFEDGNALRGMIILIMVFVIAFCITYAVIEPCTKNNSGYFTT